MQVKCLVVGEFQSNCFLLHANHDLVIVVDPGAEPARIAAHLRENRLSVAAYLVTHGHVDHLSALGELHAAFPAPVALHADDLAWAFTDAGQLLPFYPVPRRPAQIERVLHDGEEWTDAGLRWTVLATPGHSPGSVCFHFPRQRILFSGDTLFSGSVGRTDLPGGNPRQLADSLRRLAILPDLTAIYPGHGPVTTLSDEKKFNYFLQSL